jgi:hypothetical protein
VNDQFVRVDAARPTFLIRVAMGSAALLTQVSGGENGNKDLWNVKSRDASPFEEQA